MEAKQIARTGRHLSRFLCEFHDCFGRSEPREHLRQYVGIWRTPMGVCGPPPVCRSSNATAWDRYTG